MADEKRVEKYAIFLNNLESWIDAIVSQDSMSEEALIERIKDSYKRSLQANVDFHSDLAVASEQAGELEAAKRHRMFERVYLALIKP